MSRSFDKRAVATGLALSLMTLSAQAQDQPMLEEVVVTAQKRAESLQDVPVAVTAVSGEKIESAGIQGLEDLSSYIPNVSINTQAGGSPGNIVIRGVGSGNNPAFEQSVGMFIDGVYAGRSRQYLVPFLDLASVEVLKGPQGTLFGKNTVAGAISITSAKPGDSFEATLRAHYEPEYGTQEYAGAVSGPLTDKLSGRIAAKYRDQGGYFENLVRGGEEPEMENGAVRASFVYLPTDAIEVLTKLEYAQQEATGSTYQVSTIGGSFRGSRFADVITPLESGRVDDKTTSNSFNGEFNNTDTLNGVINVTWDLDNFTLTSIIGYSEYDSDYKTDVDFSDLQLLESVATETFDQLSQEFRIASPGGETVNYIAGLYLETQELENAIRNDLDSSPANLALPLAGSLSEFSQDGDTFAVFGQATWNFSDTWAITGGLRWATEKKEVALNSLTTEFGTNIPSVALEPISNLINGRQTFLLEDDRKTSNWSPTINLQWDFSAEGMAYFRASRGFKSGGFNAALVDGDADRFEFDDEVVDSLELGSKLSLLDGAATLNVALFYNVFSDRQVSSFTENGFVVGNAAESTSKGLEADARWRATENLTLSLSLAYLTSEYDDFSDANCSTEQVRAENPTPGCNALTETQDLTGETTTHAPEFAGTFIANYIYPIAGSMELRLDLDVIYSDSYQLTQALDSNLEQDSFTKVNARFGLAGADDVWEVSLVGKNLTDEVTSDYGAGIPLFPGAYFKAVGAPRTIAVEGIYRFF